MANKIEVPISRLLISFGLIFILGILFAVFNGYYTEETGSSFSWIVYGISFISLVIGAVIILLFQWKINEIKLKSILNILPADEKAIFTILIENNNSIEQNKLVALSGYNKVKISRILTKYEQKGIISKKGIGNTNMIILKLR